MFIKTSELQGSALDWAVAKCEGFEPFSDSISWIIDDGGTYKQLPKYSTDWSQGGPIIEREKVCVAWLSKQDLGMEPEHYCVAHIDGIYTRYGPTPLIAAMRCYVASKLGDEVEVPDELL
jgi:hypothetical protein